MKPISITLETKSGKKIKLTADEARELWKCLDELFDPNPFKCDRSVIYNGGNR